MIKESKIFFLLPIFLFTVMFAHAQAPASAKKTEDKFYTPVVRSWDKYEQQIDAWKNSADKNLFEQIWKEIDSLLTESGTFKIESEENIQFARPILFLFRVTGKEKYWKAATVLYFLQDSSFITAPFRTEYAIIAHDKKSFPLIASQLQQSAKGNNGNPFFAIVLADVLENFPEDDVNRASLLKLFYAAADAIGKKNGKIANAELLNRLNTGKEIALTIDGFFNHETVKDITGTVVQTHYVLNQMDNGGFSFLGNIFNRKGVETRMQTVAPTAANLNKTNIYFIIDPDWPKENPSPNYILPEHIDVIYNWVKAGGVLMMFSNDSGNVEFEHYNQLAEKFGIHFNENHPRNFVKGDDFPAGTIDIPVNNQVFKTAKNIYIKEISTLSLKAPAEAVLTDKGDVIAAVSRVGKGTVFAIGDPWLYNEYLDGRKLPATLENFQAAQDLVKWLILQTKKQ